MSQVYWSTLRKAAVTLLLILIAISGYYLPIPMIEYPPGEDMQSFASSSSLMSVGSRPWMLSFVLWQVAALVWLQREKGFPLINACALRVLMLALVLAAVDSFVMSTTMHYWKQDTPSLIAILLPAISLTACSFIVIFLGLLMDRQWRGWGIWIMYSGISVSGIGLVFSDMFASYAQQAVTARDVGVLVFLTLVEVILNMI